MNSIDAKYISDNIETVKDFVTAEMTESQFLSSIEKDMTSLQQFFMYYKCAIMEVETKFKVLNEQFSLHGESNPIEFIESRIKSYGSLYKKMESKSIPKNLEAIENSIHDIAGVRVVCSFIQDIYHLADCFLHRMTYVLSRRRIISAILSRMATAVFTL